MIAALLGIGGTIRAFLKSLPWQVYAIAGAVAAVLFFWHVHAGWQSDAYDAAFKAGVAKQKVLTDAEIVKNGIQRTSITTLQGIIADKNRESEARAKAFADSKAQDVANRTRLDKQYAATDAQRARLEAIARVPGGNEACRAPKALSDALSGL